MVIELFDENEYTDTISRNPLIVMGIADKGARLWKYLETLLRNLESQLESNIKVVITDVEVVKNLLQEFETDVAKRRSLIKVFLNGVCIFTQEDVTENIANDMEMLKRGIKDSLKRRSVIIRFTVK
ncbi:MAG: hypothetical protein N3D82_03885 [Ignisphaera sp.]|nr:hypothetical protein [Ignisphaera sp.]MCX8168148.1 hypothetical protein [Ignisphaera sp.]MDW8085212.1 hypothetical protein [Ignisphaera sp.]